VRALRPFGDDSTLLEAANRGEFAINGFRNRDLPTIFFPRAAKSQQDARRRSGWVSRKLRLLRAHGLITRVTGTHRYQLTVSGRKATTAILTALRKRGPFGAVQVVMEWMPGGDLSWINFPSNTRI
jgi:hypothetical protein